MSNIRLVLKDKNSSANVVELSELPRYKFASDKSVENIIEDLDKYLKIDEDKRQIYSKSEIKNLISDFKRRIYNTINEHEYAYIRTKNLEDIKQFVDDATVNIDEKDKIHISSMFYKSFDNNSFDFNDSMFIPFDNDFISYKTLTDSTLEMPKTPSGKLLKKFQKRGFIVNAVYKDNNIEDDDPNEQSPEHWTTEPLGVDNVWRYEWEIHRVRKLVNIEGREYMIWNRFTYPVIKSQYHSGNDQNNIFANNYGIYLTSDNIIYKLNIDDKGNVKAEKMKEE